MPPAHKKSSAANVQSQTLQLACAECKRLKLKCSKTVPCEACSRRGCESICPNGSLKSGRGTRFILSNTEELHEEIERLRCRIKELESALAELQGQVSTDPHPLLKSSLALISPTAASGKGSQDEEEVLIDTFGSLTIGPDGSSEWFGRHSGSEFFIGPQDRSKPPDSLANSAKHNLPAELLLLSKMFPFKSTANLNDELRRQVRARLPTREVAWELAHQYYGHIAWSTNPLHWTEFLDQAMEPVYGNQNPTDEQVALVFVVLALGTALDLKKLSWDQQATEYIHLSRVSLMLGEDLLESRSFVAIQTLHLIAFFYQIAHDPSGPAKSWMLTAMAIRMAQSAGLHRDSERWDKFPAEAERRRRLWWEISTFEFMQSFTMGRPRLVNTAQCDTKMPKDTEDSGGAPSWNRVKYRWVHQCLGPCLDQAHGPKPPPYSQILKIDRQMRDYPIPEVPLNDDVPLSSGMRVIVLLMRAFSTGGMREIALLYLHRTYLVESLMRWPEDPLKSKFALSVLAAHRSSILIIQGTNRLHEQLPDLVPRIAFLYLHTFSAYVCLCAIVIRSPDCALARSSLTEIDRARVLFTFAKSYRVTKAQGVIDKLHAQAHAAYDAFRAGNWPPPKRTKASADDDSAVDDEYVLRFAGASGMVATREVQDRIGNRPAKPAHPQAPEGIHPTLFEYLKVFQNAGIDCGYGEILKKHPTQACPFPPLQIAAHQVPNIPDLALFRPLPPTSIWPTDDESTSIGTSFSPSSKTSANSTSPMQQAAAMPTASTDSPPFSLGAANNLSPFTAALGGIDDPNALYQMDMDALLQSVSAHHSVSMGLPGNAQSQIYTQSQPSSATPAATGMNPTTNDSPLDFNQIFAMQAPGLDAGAPEHGWENFLTNGWES